MTAPSAAFLTLGCKTNHYETDAIRMQFEAAGFQIVAFSAAADVYLVNTCTVTAEADRKSRQMLRRARQANPEALVVAMGCQVEIGDAATWADLSIGNARKSTACGQVIEALRQRGGQADLPACPATQPLELSAYDELGQVSSQSETRAYIKIEDGCNQFCSYCAIPLARGRVRSRERGHILAEARGLADRGYREVVLTGIHLCSYGSDRGEPAHAVMELALELANMPGIERIRLGSLDPGMVTDTFIRLAAQNPRLCPHFHLSLQSGCDRILARMNRHYTSDGYRAVVRALRESFSDPGITTDLIVGFPGEAEADFAQSLAFCREMDFLRMHVFRFSPRQGTRAASLPDPVAPQLIARRSRQMMSLASDMALAGHTRQIGRQMTVLTERQRPDGLYEGYSETYVPVRFRARQTPEAGSLVTVTGRHATADYLLAEQT
ncbi:MAG: tRNA (N(6)-L-threonylcarbamoyladenosine(37)-C(2))-methylthiotransferase MtaB [Clostridiaceae bacterium]|nr:tRNA (N(6)-L-threonylcarbamoyladenosine(37)-C(2))-methylthiotransferase MtaB [Clostridiaceae bacterium]